MEERFPNYRTDSKAGSHLRRCTECGVNFVKTNSEFNQCQSCRDKMDADMVKSLRNIRRTKNNITQKEAERLRLLEQLSDIDIQIDNSKQSLNEEQIKINFKHELVSDDHKYHDGTSNNGTVWTLETHCTIVRIENSPENVYFGHVTLVIKNQYGKKYTWHYGAEPVGYNIPINLNPVFWYYDNKHINPRLTKVSYFANFPNIKPDTLLSEIMIYHLNECAISFRRREQWKNQVWYPHDEIGSDKENATHLIERLKKIQIDKAVSKIAADERQKQIELEIEHKRKEREAENKKAEEKEKTALAIQKKLKRDRLLEEVEEQRKRDEEQQQKDANEKALNEAFEANKLNAAKPIAEDKKPQKKDKREIIVSTKIANFKEKIEENIQKYERMEKNIEKQVDPKSKDVFKLRYDLYNLYEELAEYYNNKKNEIERDKEFEDDVKQTLLELVRKQNEDIERNLFTLVKKDLFYQVESFGDEYNISCFPEEQKLKDLEPTDEEAIKLRRRLIIFYRRFNKKLVDFYDYLKKSPAYLIKEDLKNLHQMTLQLSLIVVKPAERLDILRKIEVAIMKKFYESKEDNFNESKEYIAENLVIFNPDHFNTEEIILKTIRDAREELKLNKMSTKNISTKTIMMLYPHLFEND